MTWEETVDAMQDVLKDTFAATSVLYTPVGQAQISISGIFREPYVGVDGVGVGVQSVAPTLDVKEADIGQPVSRQDLVTVNGVNYRVSEIEPDGEGMTKLSLKKA